MKTRLLLLGIALTLLLSIPAWSAHVKLIPSIYGGFTFGETEYEISGIGVDDQDRLLAIRSLLEFPLDQVMGGVGLRINSTRQLRPWSITLDIHTSFTDPGGIMKDHDWITVQDGFDGKFSYTESSSEGSAVVINLTGDWFLYHKETVLFGPRVGFRFQRIQKDIIDFEGWWIDYDTEPYARRPQGGQGKGIEYRIHYFMPMLGLAARIDKHQHYRLEAHISYLPIFYDDFDDHLFRKKTAESSGHGSGVLAGMAARVNLPSTRANHPFIELRAEIISLSASGDQTQTWYGDDGATPGFDDTGQIITGINHEVRSTQSRVALQFGTMF